MFEPLLIPLAAIASGILIAHLTPFTVREAVTPALLFLLIAIFSHFRRLVGCRRLALWAACVPLGILTDLWHYPGPPPEIDAGAGEILVLEGCVVTPPVLMPDREQFVLELEPRARARVTLALQEGAEPPALEYGQKVSIEARVRRTRNFNNPGAFNYIQYLARQDIYWTASARAGSPVTPLAGRCGSQIEAAIFYLRSAALRRIEQLYAGDQYAIGMMEAILIGESSKLEKVWTDHFRRTGTFHALVISGLHVTVLAGTLLFFLRLCMMPEMTALLLATLGAWMYAAVSGWSAPVVRAAGGFTLYLVGRYFFRRGRVLNLLAAIAIGYLLWDPGQLFDASFQLSFLSVAAIGAFVTPILEATSKPYARAGRELHDVGRDPRLPPVASALRVELRLLAETVCFWVPIPRRWVLAVLGLLTRIVLYAWEMILISAVIQVALALPMALYFHRISVTGLSANLLIVPALTLVVPIGFLAIFTGWPLLAWLALTLLKFSEWVAGMHVRWEPAFRVPDPPLWLSIVFVAALTLVGVALRFRSHWVWPATGAAAGLFGLILTCPFAPQIEPGTLELTAVDVGQGDALLVALPDGKTLLVDAGGIPAYGRKTKPKMDIGEDVVSPYLWTRRIHRVDIAAITHLHEDHVGGLLALLENFHPRELWTGATPDNELWRTIADRAAALGIRVVARRAGERLGALDVLAPAADYRVGSTARNNDSLVLRIRHGEHTFLLMGDSEKAIEHRILADSDLSRTTVLKVAHHGSKTSSTEEFLDVTGPEFGIISAGFENSFRHPHAEVLDRLAAHHVAVLRTDLDGLVSIRSDGHRLTVLRAGAGRWAQSDPNFLAR